MTTIYALATPRGRSGVALVRISGAGARATLLAMTRKPVPPARRSVKRRLWPAEAGGAPLDEAMATFFPGPGSYTGEDVVELGIHGGPAVIEAVLDALARRPGHRMAEPGEFSRIAFYNEKLDLVELEGLADLIAAETEAQRVQALRQADGEASARYEAWRAELISLMAAHEATIDFSDDELPLELVQQVTDRAQGLAGAIARFLDDGRKGEVLRDGLSVAILGAPNAGKSSLLNRLAGREAAIVTPIAGTTRDVIEIRLNVVGLPMTIADTAGLRESLDQVEQEGVRRALDRAERSDVNILVFDGSNWPEIDQATLERIDERAILVLNKADLTGVPIAARIAGLKAIGMSALSGEGVGALKLALTDRAQAMMPSGEGPVVTRARHRALLGEAAAALGRAVETGPPELRGEELRLAALALGRLVGRIDVEEVLGGIFQEFCIGK